MILMQILFLNMIIKLKLFSTLFLLYFLIMISKLILLPNYIKKLYLFNCIIFFLLHFYNYTLPIVCHFYIYYNHFHEILHSSYFYTHIYFYNHHTMLLYVVNYTLLIIRFFTTIFNILLYR